MRPFSTAPSDPSSTGRLLPPLSKPLSLGSTWAPGRGQRCPALERQGWASPPAPPAPPDNSSSSPCAARPHLQNTRARAPPAPDAPGSLPTGLPHRPSQMGGLVSQRVRPPVTSHHSMGASPPSCSTTFPSTFRGSPTCPPASGPLALAVPFLPTSAKLCPFLRVWELSPRRDSLNFL